MIALVLLALTLELAYGTPKGIAPEWKEVSYKGHTAYEVRGDSAGAWLHAEAHGRHSALFYRLDRDVRGATLGWRWRVTRHPGGANTRTKAGDDRAAAVFVLIKRSWLPWRTRGLIYQWVAGESSGVWRSSPYARHIKVVTLANAPASDVWREERRDLSADLREAFGAAPERIEAIGVLSDADNTGDRTSADFGVLRVEWPEGPR